MDDLIYLLKAYFTKLKLLQNLYCSVREILVYNAFKKSNRRQGSWPDLKYFPGHLPKQYSETMQYISHDNIYFLESMLIYSQRLSHIVNCNEPRKRRLCVSF
jgi:hypothetical protein